MGQFKLHPVGEGSTEAEINVVLVELEMMCRMILEIFEEGVSLIDRTVRLDVTKISDFLKVIRSIWW